MRLTLPIMGLMALTACAPGIPDSAKGVGFEDYDTYRERQNRDAQLEGTASLNAPAAVATGTLDADATAANSGEAVVNADPSNPPPSLNNAGISDENDFDAVAERQSIESDAQRIERNRAAYQVIEPTDLPSRAGAGGPNIVAYALKTSNPKGTSVYKRSSFNAQKKFERNCAKYPSPDKAQVAFLANGGPDRDRLGLDPDGDGYACGWDPAPFRTAANVQE